MTGDRHVRFCESGRGRIPPATQPMGGSWKRSETHGDGLSPRWETPGTGGRAYQSNHRHRAGSLPDHPPWQSGLPLAASEETAWQDLAGN